MDRPLTSRGRHTRDRIIAGAAEVLLERGVDATIMTDVMARTRTSKSQLFHYFPDGKEQLLVAVLRQQGESLLTGQEPFLRDLGTLRTWDAWQAWRDAVVRYFRSDDNACALQGLAQHVGSTTSGRHDVVATLFERWRELIADGMRAMQAAGLVAADLDTRPASAALVAGIQGGVVLMRSTGTTAYLEAALDQGIAQMRAHGGLVGPVSGP